MAFRSAVNSRSRVALWGSLASAVSRIRSRSPFQLPHSPRSATVELGRTTSLHRLPRSISRSVELANRCGLAPVTTRTALPPVRNVGCRVAASPRTARDWHNPGSSCGLRKCGFACGCDRLRQQQLAMPNQQLWDAAAIHQYVAGLISRCTTNWRCAYSMAVQTSRITAGAAPDRALDAAIVVIRIHRHIHDDVRQALFCGSTIQQPAQCWDDRSPRESGAPAGTAAARTPYPYGRYHLTANIYGVCWSSRWPRYTVPSRLAPISLTTVGPRRLGALACASCSWKSTTPLLTRSWNEALAAF